MFIRALTFILFSFVVACSGTEDNGSPIELNLDESQEKPDQPEEKMLSSERDGTKLIIKLGDQVLNEVENGGLIDESGRFLAYTNGSSSTLVHNSGKTLMSCSDICIVKVSANFASVQWGPGKGSLYDHEGKSIYSSDTQEEVFYKISNNFASVSSEKSARVFQASKGGIFSCSNTRCSVSLSDTFAAISRDSSATLYHVEEGSVYSCSNVKCDLLVSNGFAAILDARDNSGTLVGSDGSVIFSFDPPGRVKLSNTFAAIEFANGGDLYHVEKGSIYSSSVPVTFEVNDEVASANTGSYDPMTFGPDGNIY